jgi:hypothetical protein
VALTGFVDRAVGLVHNRRQFRRVKNDNLARDRADSGGFPQLYNLVDLSEGGAQISADKELRPSEVLHLVLNLRELELEIPVQAQVVWAKPMTSGCRAGLQFMALHRRDQVRIRSYIASFS